MDPYALLVIARTYSLAERLRNSLDAEQYLVRWVPSTAQALKLKLQPSLLILDLPPSGGGRSVPWLKEKFQAPMLVLLRPGQPIPNGADASLARLFEAEQIVETIHRTLMHHTPHIVKAAGLSLDTRTRRLEVDGNLHQLRPIGCRILALLMERVDRVVPRDELFQQVWSTDDGDNTRVLDVHIAYLRRLLEPNPSCPTLILTERGVGYRLHPPS